MQIWLDANRTAHDFIAADYWHTHFDAVKASLPRAEVYVHVADESARIEGFIGLIDDFIAGIFVCGEARSRGIGKRLLDHAKSIRSRLTLHVYRKNERATAFYLREHFTIDSLRRDEQTNEAELVLTWTK